MGSIEVTRKMKFRPLCIDYHSRAQEIIITERNNKSRRAAQSLLSHRCSELSSQHRGHDPAPPLNDENDENCEPSNSVITNIVSDTVDNDRKYHRSISESNRQVSTIKVQSNAIAPHSSFGNRSITEIFGPTISPSECALKQVSPVTRGPVRGCLLPVDKTLPAMKSIELYTKISAADDIHRNRNHPPSSLGCDESDNHISFIDNMSLFLRSGYMTVGSPTKIFDGTKNDRQNTTAAADKLDLMNAPYKIFRHEPEDVTQIQAMKSFQILHGSNFAHEVLKLVGPRQSSRSLAGDLHRFKNKISSASVKPSLSFSTSFDVIDINDSDIEIYKNDCSLRLFSGHCADSLEDRGTNKQSLEDQLFIIRLDPEFDPCESTSANEEMDSAGVERSLKDFCSANSILQEFALPRRLEHKNSVPAALLFHSSCSISHKFEFVEKALTRFEDSRKKDDNHLSALAENELLVSCSNSFPKSITLESELSLDDDDNDESISSHQANIPLGLPSFVQSLPFSCEKRTTTRRGGKQKRFVESSARVIKIDAMSKMCGLSNVAYMYLPQIKLPGWTEGDTRTELSRLEQQQQCLAVSSGDLVSFVRNCVSSSKVPSGIHTLDGIDLLQGYTSSYPILPWFKCDDEFVEGEQIDHVYVDEEAVDVKRKMFCDQAIRVGDTDRFRCILFTGCRSKVNQSRRFVYHGFLTNQEVSPRVFQQRYQSMIELNKKYQRESITGNICERRYKFSRMVLVDFADRFKARTSKKVKRKIQQSKSFSNRGATFIQTLSTTRHGKALPVQNVGKKRITGVGGKQSLAAAHVELLMSSFDQKKEEVSVLDTVSYLGTEDLHVRGELLHLVTKACELKEERDAYLEEIALINRSREDGSFDDEICDKVDVAADSGACENETHHASDNIAMEEGNEEQRMKKKRKKEKKKKMKKKEKKSRKRKRQDEDDANTKRDHSNSVENPGVELHELGSHTNEGKPQSASVKRLRIDESVPPSTTRKPWRAIPSIELGITPIHRPKERQLQNPSSMHAHETQLVQNIDDSISRRSRASLKDSPSEKSPDSVAVANLARDKIFAECDEMKDVPVMESQPPSENGYFDREKECVDICMADNETNEPITEWHNQGNSPGRIFEAKASTFTILTSENFLEQFGESIMELASGRWFTTLTTAEKLQLNCIFDNDHEERVETGLDPVIPAQAKLNVSDNPLLDITGVDIELADDKALIVQHDVDKVFIKRLVYSTLRYPSIHVILCVDNGTSSEAIAMMQNALMQCPQEVTFEYTSSRTLSSSIAMQYFKSVMGCQSKAPSSGQVEQYESNRISQFASDENIQERARFLICLLPTMTAHIALRCLSADFSEIHVDGKEYDGGAKSMQTLLSLARKTDREIFPHKVSSMMPKSCADQLWLVANTSSSFATRQR